MIDGLVLVEMIYNGDLFHLFQFKIALCQLSVTTDKEKNIARAKKAIEDAAQQGAKLVLLPVSLTEFFLIFSFE